MKYFSPHSGVASGLAVLWIGGARLRASLYGKALLQQRSLRASVISIGNLAWGGAGKTPFTIWLAGRLQSAGLSVSILTRGYGRRSRGLQVHPPGASSETAARDGDEVQLYLRHLNLPVGISRSRYQAGRALEARFPIDVHLLDDGFQHLALARNLDLVLIDAMNPWGARGGWPLLLREGFSALRRAQAVLLTRCESVDPARVEKLKAVMRSYNPEVECFTVRTRLVGFESLRDRAFLSVDEFMPRHPVAFCAVGNPRAFAGMLAGAGIQAVRKAAFVDHHRYTAKDFALLVKLAKENRADCFVTTEKDIVNFPPSAELPHPVYWAAIEPVVDNEDRLLRWIGDRLHFPALTPGIARSS